MSINIGRKNHCTQLHIFVCYIKHEPVQNKLSAGQKGRYMASKKTKKLSECLSGILNLCVKNEEDVEFLKGLGINRRSDNKTLIMARLFSKAASGDIQAIKEVRSIMADSEQKDFGKLLEIIEAVQNVK